MAIAALLGCTVQEMGQRMTAEELGEWEALYAAEPWGPARDNLHAGIIASAVTNMAGRQLADGAAAATPGDYMIGMNRQEPPQQIDPAEFARRIG